MRADREKVGWCYFDDLGEPYWTNVMYGTVKQKDESGRPLVGGRPPRFPGWAPSELPPDKRLILAEAKSRGLKVRTVTVVDLKSGTNREVVVYSLDAPLWVGTATAIELDVDVPIDAQGTYVTREKRSFQVRGWSEELYRGRKRHSKTAEPARDPEAPEVFDSTLDSYSAPLTMGGE